MLVKTAVCAEYTILDFDFIQNLMTFDLRVGVLEFLMKRKGWPVLRLPSKIPVVCCIDVERGEELIIEFHNFYPS